MWSLPKLEILASTYLTTFCNLISAFSASCEWNAEEQTKKQHERGEPVCVRNNYMEAAAKFSLSLKEAQEFVVVTGAKEYFPSGPETRRIFLCEFVLTSFLARCGWDAVQILWGFWAIKISGDERFYGAYFVFEELANYFFSLHFLAAWKPLF